MQILSLDKVEIRIEKQPETSSCKWCLYCKVEKKDKTKLLLMIKTNVPPYLLFQENKINLIKNSEEIKQEVLEHSEL